MPHFMRHHIGVRKITRRTEIAAQLVEEIHIQINLAVSRAIKRTRCFIGFTTGRRILIGKQNKLRLFVGSAHRLENAGPGVFGICQNSRHELFGFIIGRRWSCALGGRLLDAWRYARIALIQKLQRINPEHQFQDQIANRQQNHGSKAHVRQTDATTGRNVEPGSVERIIRRRASCFVAHIFNVVRLAATLPFHHALPKSVR